MRSRGLLLVCVFVLLACALGGCAGSKTDLGSPTNAWAPAPGATAADSAEQVRVVQAIRAMDNLRTDRCTERHVSDTAVLGSAVASERFPRHERWIIDRCGKRVSYLVEFSREDSGGVAITVRFE